MVETYLSSRPQIKTLLLLMDVRRVPGDWEKQLISWSTIHGYAVLPVVTKIDKLAVSKRKPAIAKVAKEIGLAPDQMVAWSAPSGEGLDELWARINHLLD